MEKELLWQVVAQVMEVLIRVLLPILLTYLVVFINKKLAEAGTLVRQNELDYAVNVIWQLVHAAEQNGLKKNLVDIGKDKKAWVLAETDRILKSRGMIIPLAELDALVEAQVNMAFEKVKVPKELQDEASRLIE
jgi:hypothetical protein